LGEGEGKNKGVGIKDPSKVRPSRGFCLGLEKGAGQSTFYRCISCAGLAVVNGPCPTAITIGGRWGSKKEEDSRTWVQQPK